MKCIIRSGVILAACLLAFNATACDPVDRVTGNFARKGLVGAAFWPHAILQGNLQVHNFDSDGDS